jgi:hypothetical protein
MITIKKFKDQKALDDYLSNNKHLDILRNSDITAMVLLTDEFFLKHYEEENVYDYINNHHYEDINIHYGAYYGEY